MSKNIRVAVLFGGRSAEHEVSLQSAWNVVSAMDREKYDIVLIGIDREGQWFLTESSEFLLHAEDPELVALNKSTEMVALVGGAESRKLMGLSSGRPMGRIDVAFPVLHGPYGEDGTVQGLLKLAGVPFVGAGVLGSAVGMDKDVMKRLLRDGGVPIADFTVARRELQGGEDAREITERLGLPLFVKPANLGSSVGVTKVMAEGELAGAVAAALQFDTKVVIEEFVRGREIECSVLGGDRPMASMPGEIVPRGEFYSYEAKYVDEDGASLLVPADLSAEVTRQVQKMAIKSFELLCCEGMARVDTFVGDSGDVVVNELNTIPGFTKISMYPRLWEASGVSFSELVDRLIGLALERADRESRLKLSR